MKKYYKIPPLPRDLYPDGFVIFTHSREAKRLLAEGGDNLLISLIAALIARGITYFEAIFDAVARVVGNTQLEQRITVLLDAQQGQLWEEVSGLKDGPSYRLI